MVILIIAIALALLAATIILFHEYQVLFMKPSKTGKIQDSEILAVKNKIGEHTIRWLKLRDIQPAR